MRKIPLLLFVLVISVAASAAGIRFIENKTWKEILALAKKENKLIFLDAYATWCGPCKYLQKNVFTDSKVGAYFNSKFINVKMDMEDGEGIALSETYNVQSYPTLFFIDGDGKLVHKAVGALEAVEFLALGKKALDPSTQFYTTRDKALQGKITPDVFVEWITAAEEMDEEGVNDVVTSYLSNAKYLMSESGMLAIIMDHAELLTKAQLDEIYKNREVASGIMNETIEEFDAHLLTKVISYAEKKSTVGEQLDFVKFKTIVDSYYPKKSLLETQKMKVSYYNDKKENAKCLAELAILLDKFSSALPVSDMAASVIGTTPIIAEEKKSSEFIKKVKAYTVLPTDKDKVYLKDFTLLFLYHSIKDQQNVNIYKDKINSNSNTPDNILKLMKDLLEE